MDVKIDFDPAEIAKKLADTLVNDTFKKFFTDAVEREVKRLNEGKFSADSIIQETVKEYIRWTMRDLLDREYKPQIEEIIRRLMTKEKLESLSAELMERIVVKDRY